MMNDINNLVVKPTDTLKKVMEVINSAPHKGLPSGIAIISNRSNKLLGVVTDGDIRRAMLKGTSLSSQVKSVMNVNPIFVNRNQNVINQITDLESLLSKSKKSKTDFTNVVVVDNKHRVFDVIDLNELKAKSDVRSKKICVVGLGFVGLTLALSLADVGFKVIGVDSDKSIIANLRRGKPHIHEIGLDSLLRFHIGKNLLVSQNYDKTDCDVYIICVQTPLGPNEKPNVKHLSSAVKYVSKLLKKGDLVINRSTVPVGTTRNLVIDILQKYSKMKAGNDFFLAMAPERTVAGKALQELKELPQIIGGINEDSSSIASNIFQNLTPTIVNVDQPEQAEFIKLIDNTYRDVTFGFSNELALMSSKFGFNSSEIIKAANEGYSRNNIPIPSPGVGGICLKKDPYFFINSAKNEGYSPKLASAARQINESMVDHIIRQIKNYSNKNGKKLSTLKIFIIGFAFKGEPETSDVRQSTAIDLVGKISKFNNNIWGYDPVVQKAIMSKIDIRNTNIKNGFKNADVVIIMNNHNSYLKLDIYSLINTMKKPSYLFDGWSMFNNKSLDDIDTLTYATL